MPLIGQSRPTTRHLGFRPAELTPAPSWCTGLRAGSIPGGGWPNPHVFAQWWRDLADLDDQFTAQLVAEDLIVADKVRRTPTRLVCRVKADSLDSRAGTQNGCRS